MSKGKLQMRRLPAVSSTAKFRSVALATGLQMSAMVLGVIAGVVIARAGGTAVKGEATAFAAATVLVGSIANLDLPQQALLIARRMSDNSAVMSILARSWMAYVLLAIATVLAGLMFDESLVVITLGSLMYLIGGQLAIGANGVFSPVSSAISMVVQQAVMVVGATGLALAGRVDESTVRLLIVASFIAPMPYLMARLLQGRLSLAHPALPAIRMGLFWQPARVLQFALMRADVLVAYLLFSPATAGIYSVALSTAALVGIAPTQFANMVLHRGAKSRQLNTSVELAGALVVATFFGIGLASTGMWLIPFLYGDAFADAYTLMLLCLPGAIAFGGVQVLGNRERMSKSPWRLTVATSAGVVAMAGVIFLTRDWIGVNGIAIASSVGAVAALLLLITPARGRNRAHQKATPQAT